MAGQPTGTVSLLFSDIEGSTRLLRRLGTEVYAEALELHRGLLRAAFAERGGYEVGCDGDAFFVAFSSAQDALIAAAAAQSALAGADWPEGEQLRVRMGIHSGEPLVVPPNYVGLDVHKAARIMAAGHGGQVLVSQATRDLVASRELRDLGPHRLKDLAEPERIYQLGESEFPPLKSLNRTNLPVAAGPLLGREPELARIRQRFAEGVRLLTLTGPGGSGKTRLALQAAAELVDEFVDGVFFVALAPLAGSDAVPGAVSQALGLRPDDDLDDYLASRRVLLVLDNAEHLEGVEHAIADLLLGEVVALVTSRSRLHLSSEHEFPIEPLSIEAASEMFVLRAAAVGRIVVPDATVGELCRRLDNLPLAIDLAAARTKVLAPQAILDRLERALPFLTGGPRDAPERQRTLRATIEWSYELLSEAERVAFGRLGVFRGGFSLDAAEAVAKTELDAIASLVDKSLLKPTEKERFLMLETLREFALEQLAAAGEAEATTLRHARWYEQRLVEFSSDVRGHRTPEILAWYDAEQANTWAALDELLPVDSDAAFSLAFELGPYWFARGLMGQGRRWLTQALASEDAPTRGRARGLARLGELAVRQGDPDRAEPALREAVQVGSERTDDTALANALTMLAHLADQRGEYQQAVELARRAVEAAERMAYPNTVEHARNALASSLVSVRRFEEAAELFELNVAISRQRGDEMNVAVGLSNLGLLEFQRLDYAKAREHLSGGLELQRRYRRGDMATITLALLGLIDLAEGNLDAALHNYAEALPLALEAGSGEWVAWAISGIGAAHNTTDPIAAAQLWAAGLAINQARGLALPAPWQEQDQRLRQTLNALLGAERLEQALAEGHALSEQEAIAKAFELAARLPVSQATPPR